MAVKSRPKPTPNIPNVLPRASSRTSKYLVFDPRHHRSKLVAVALVRFSLVALLVIAIAFGASNFFVTIHDKKLFGYDVDVDTQLAFLGIFNKTMDVLVLTSLQDLSHVLVLVWMLTGMGSSRYGIVGRGTGARLSDLEMFEELSKPWRAVSAFWTRCRTRGWSWRGFGRFVLTLIISMSVLLQGLAINTLGIPKDRWYPSDKVSETTIFRHPSAQLQSIDTSLWSRGFDVVGGGRYSWGAAEAFGTASAYVSLQDLAPAFGDSPRKWRSVGPEDAHSVTLDTRYNGSRPLRGYAVQSSINESTFRWAQANGSSEARAAMGWMAGLDMVVPMVTVNCTDADTFLTEVESIAVDQTSTNTSSFTLSTRSVSLDDPYDTILPSIQCSINLSRAIYPIRVYLKDNAAGMVYADRDINDRPDFDDTAANLPLASGDIYLADQMRVHLALIIQRFEHFLPDMSAAQLLGRNALHLRSIRPDIITDAAALAPAVTLITTKILAQSAWNYTMDTDNMLNSTTVRWQLLGTGPRLDWEWVAAIVLVVLILVNVAGFVLSFVSRLAAPEFLKPSGMLVAANSSDRLPVLSGPSIGDDRAIEEQTFFLREADPQGTGRVSIVQGPRQGSKVDVARKWKWS